MCVYVVPDLLSLGAPPVFPSVHCPYLRPHEFSPPTPSGRHCEATHTHTHDFIIKSHQIHMLKKTHTMSNVFLNKTGSVL